jgi:disulfide bond formation protein DsbB
MDAQTAAPVSPTGAPLLPPSVARWVTLAVVAALAGLGAAVAMYPDCRPLQIALAVVTALAAVLGIASPGLRRVVVALLLVGTVTSASGCAWLAKQADLKADLSACASTAVVGEVEALMGEAATALQSSPVDWDRHLDQLVARGGQAALCAILALADALSGGTGGSQTDPLGDYDRALRAAYLRTYARGVAAR